jgi:transposase
MNEIEKLNRKIRDLEDALENEKKEKDRLASEKDRLASEKDRIASEMDKIRAEKEKLEKEFEEYRAKHAVTVGHLKHAMNIKPDAVRIPKTPGAKKGHKAYNRRIPERIDFIKALNPKDCPNCHTSLSETQEIRHRHVTEIEIVVRPKTIRYDIHRKYCRTCDKLVEEEVPDALPHARFGIKLMLLVMYLKLGLRLPCNKICDYLATMYNLHISQGEVIVILRQLARAFGDHYADLEKIVKLSRVKYTDSTSWRISGKNYFAWVFIGCGVVLYKIRKRNNHKVGLALFGRNQKGNILVVDRHSAYRTLARKAGFILQYCWSHILEDSKSLAKHFGPDGRFVHRKLKAIYGIAKSVRHTGNEQIIEQLKIMVLELSKRHYEHITVRRFVNRLCNRDLDSLFLFVTDLDVDPTNNISERELRALVIIRKISNGSRSRRGANASVMLLSIIQTLRMQKKNVLEGLIDIIKSPSGC